MYLCLLVKRTMTVIDIAQSRDTVFKGIQNNLLQRAGRELGALARYQLEAISQFAVNVAPVYIGAVVAQKGPPLGFEVGPHPLDGIQLRGRRRQEEQLHPKVAGELFGLLALVRGMVVQDDICINGALQVAADVFEELAEESCIGLVDDGIFH